MLYLNIFIELAAENTSLQFDEGAVFRISLPQLKGTHFTPNADYSAWELVYNPLVSARELYNILRYTCTFIFHTYNQLTFLFYTRVFNYLPCALRIQPNH